MEDPRSDSLNELVANFSVADFAKLKEHVERRDRATVAPMERAPSTRSGMFLPSTVPELRGRENLVTFMQRFRTWAYVSRCDSVLDSEIIVKTSGTPLAELEILHDRTLIDDSLQAWQAPTKALEKEEEMLEMVLDIGSPSEAWCVLAKMADESEEVAYDRTKREFETLEIGVSKSVAEYFARVHIVLMKLERYKIATPAREIRRTVLSSLTSRFRVRLVCMRGEEILNCQICKLGLFGRRSSSKNKSGGTPQPTRWPLLIWAVAKPELKMEPVDETGKAGARASATTVAASNNISNRGILRTHLPHLPRSTSTSHPHASNSNHYSRPPGGSNSDIHNHSSGDRGIRRRLTDPGPTGRDHLPVSSSTSGPGGRGHLPNSSTVAEGLTCGDDIIGEAIRRTGSRLCVSGAVRRGISPQTAGQLGLHPCHSIVRTRHHRFQELTPRSTTPAPLSPRHRTTTMDIRPLQATGLHRNTPATHLPSRCHRRTDSTNSTSISASLGS